MLCFSLIAPPMAVTVHRNGSFEPQLIKKGEKQLGGFDERIVSLYARGMSTFEDVCGVEVSPTFISQVTNAVLDKVKAWQQQPLAPVYPFDTWTV